jgi:ribonuclease PH
VDVVKYPEASSGSVLIEMGNTRVICAASFEEGVPRWMKEQNIRDYIEVWKCINQYSRYPNDLLKKVKEEITK